MYNIKLKNEVEFQCDEETTILQASINEGKVLEHSCKSGKCRSCRVQVIEGKFVEIQEDVILSKEEKEQGFILSCIAKPLSDLKLDIEDLGNFHLSKSKTLPCKIDFLEKINDTVIKVKLRLPPNSNFNYLSGQYVNIIKGDVKRSYSIANSFNEELKLEFLIKKYEGGKMSAYWFEEARVNNLLRLEGPLGTFFYRESNLSNIVFLATGTGIAPVLSILENIDLEYKEFENKKIWLFWGGRYKEDLFWEPQFKNINITFVRVLSRENEGKIEGKEYVQNAVLKQNIDLQSTQVYACGSTEMIESAKELLTKNSLQENQFYSDAFVSSN